MNEGLTGQRSGTPGGDHPPTRRPNRQEASVGQTLEFCASAPLGRGGRSTLLRHLGRAELGKRPNVLGTEYPVHALMTADVS